MSRLDLNLIHVAIVIGTRPEAIKMIPVYLELLARPRFKVTMISTGQHKQMLDQVFAVFDVNADIDLVLMRENQTLSGLTSLIIDRLQDVFDRIKPDIILVHGDTSTCLAASLVAFYNKIEVGHVEAGLRTHNLFAPWPEEMNRRLVDPISTWCFAPTDRAAGNLLEENIPSQNIYNVGNTVVDSLRIVRKQLKGYKIQRNLSFLRQQKDKKIVLVTGHRRESFGTPFRELCLGLRDIAEKCEDALVVYPVHLNPKVQEPVNQILRGVDRIILIDPLEYLDFLFLMSESYIIITDSGGIQEEAPSFGKPVLITRSVTERPEAMEHGLSKLVGTDRHEIFTEANLLLTNSEVYSNMTAKLNPYGDGKTSKKIVNILYNSFTEKSREI